MSRNFQTQLAIANLDQELQFLKQQAVSLGIDVSDLPLP